MLKYEAIFLDDESLKLIHQLETKKLDRINDEIHLTLKYRPNKNEIFNDVVGEYFEMYLIGYGNDNQNSGFEIELSDNLKNYYINYDEENPSILKKPHITASLSEEAEAVNTKNLDFQTLPSKYKIKGRLGFWIEEDDKEYFCFLHFCFVYAVSSFCLVVVRNNALVAAIFCSSMYLRLFWNSFQFPKRT